MEIREHAQPPRRRYQPPVTYRWEPAPATHGPWRIIFGIHDGTWAGRDQDMPRDTEYATWDAVKAAMQTQIDHFRTLGCAIWFAQAIGPDGTAHPILHGADYS